MKKYSQLTLEQRIVIATLYKKGVKQKEIAKEINVHPSTVSRELKRNTFFPSLGYRPTYAHQKAQRYRRRSTHYEKASPEVKAVIAVLLQRKWSPEQISNRLKLEKLYSISHESIYKMIAIDKKRGGDLYKYLRRYRRRKQRFPKQPRVAKLIQERVFIEQRKSVVENRSRLGDWERDLMIGKAHSSAIAAFVDRKTRFTKLCMPSDKKAKTLNRVTKEALKNLPCKTITNDNGTEWSHHKELSKQLKVPIYFTRPYASWEKGTCENTIGLVRQFLPKKTDFNNISHQQLKEIEWAINNRPRKTLNWRTPYEVMFNKKLHLTLESRAFYSLHRSSDAYEP